MKKFLVIILCSLFLFPLYAQEESQEEELQEEKPKKSISFARRHFEIGIDAGMGIDNNLFKGSEFLKKEILIDLTQLENDIGDDGWNINFDIPAGFFINIKNIKIGKGIWGFGFSSELDGRLNLNTPKSFFDLITEGNIEKRDFEGTFSASGRLFLGNGLNVSAKYGKLRLGVKPVIYTPLMFIPRSGIDYKFVTNESISMTTQGAIKVYTPVTEDGGLDLSLGADISLNGEYELLRFLDVGGSISNIPLYPAEMRNQTLYSLSGFNINIEGEELMGGNAPEMPPVKFDKKYVASDQRVFRPFKMDLYARYKPLSNEKLVIIPNIGFSVDINDVIGYFNAGVEGRLNLIDLFILSLSTGYEESIWIHKLGFALNLRAFEMDLAVSLRSEDFVGSFQAQGIGVNFGLRLGW
ncbi:MAG: hypothetical protein LBQ82_09000 [Treponema sp.]|nr:hypothetical protein [Treponema sp.]